MAFLYGREAVDGDEESGSDGGLMIRSPSSSSTQCEDLLSDIDGRAKQDSLQEREEDRIHLHIRPRKARTRGRPSARPRQPKVPVLHSALCDLKEQQFR